MEIQYDITEDEVVQALSMQTRWLRTAARHIPVFLVAFLLIGYSHQGCCRTDAFLWAWALLGVVTSVLWASLFAAWTRFRRYPRWARKTIRERPGHYRGVIASLDEQGFRIKSSHLEVNWRWEEMAGFRDSETVLLLCHQPWQGYVVAKKHLPADDLAAVDALVRSKLRKLN